MNESNSIDFRKDIVLEDEHVLLRPLREEDVEFLLPFALTEPDIWQFSTPSAAGESNLKNYIRAALARRDQGLEHPFIVFDKLTNRYAGCTRYYELREDYSSLFIGYTWYGKEFQGTGLNTHCKYLLLGYAFERLKLERVEFRANNQNERSKRAMIGIGCTVEGVLRSYRPGPDGKRVDVVALSMLRTEWLNGLKDRLAKRMTHKKTDVVKAGEIEFVRALPGDAEIIIQCRIDFFTEMTGSHSADAEQALRAELRRYLHKALASGDYIAWYARSGGTVAGASGAVVRVRPGHYSNPAGREAYVMSMFTYPAFRKKGIATKFIELLEKSARDMGVMMIELHASKAGEPVYRSKAYLPHHEPTYRKYI